jgi:hypothetical protein
MPARRILCWVIVLSSTVTVSPSAMPTTLPSHPAEESGEIATPRARRSPRIKDSNAGQRSDECKVIGRSVRRILGRKTAGVPFPRRKTGPN